MAFQPKFSSLYFEIQAFKKMSKERIKSYRMKSWRHLLAVCVTSQPVEGADVYTLVLGPSHTCLYLWAGSLQGGGGPAGPCGGAEGVVRGAELLRRQGGHDNLSLEMDLKTTLLHPRAHGTEQAADCRMERNHRQRKFKKKMK